MASPPVTGRSLFSDVVNSVFEPGTNSGLVRAMSYSFYALFATLAWMVYLCWDTEGRWHVFGLLGLSIALFVSMRWFIVSIAEAEEQQRLEREKAAKEGKDVPSADPNKGKTE
ncbi:hypothetical protein JCM8097_001233 [Rhodosporidiobolus ruineniae]